MKIKLLLPLTLLVCIINAYSQAPDIAIQAFAAGFSNPVDVRNCGDSRIFVVEQDGYIRIIADSGNVLPTAFLDIDAIVQSGGERGLLGLAFHPDYKNNGYFYVYYTNNSGNLAISRFSVSAADSNLADAASELNLITIPHPTNANHNGGCIRFGPDGYLYFGTGDGGGGGDQPNNAQNPAQRLGKILRIDVDHGSPYAIPADNPYRNDSGYADEIWAVGMRNPWRWSFDRMTGDLWIGDVGQGAYEEVDFVKGAQTLKHNFGWRCYEGFHAYNTAGCQAQSSYEDPIYELTHTGSGACSVVGGYVYRGGKYGDMFGYYFFGDYCSDTIHVLKRDNSGAFTHYNTITYNAALSAFGEDYLGNLYVANLTNGDVRKIVSNNCAPVAFIADEDTVRVCADSILLKTPYDPALIYAWTIPGGSSTTNEAWVAQSGWAYLTVLNLSACISRDSAYINILGAPPVASFTGLDTIYCSNLSSADTLIATPAGGVFTGQGITTDVFDPAVSGDGLYVITYQYTDSNLCVSSTSQITTVETCSGIIQSASSGLEITSIVVNADGTADIGVKSPVNASSQYLLNDCMGRMIATGNCTLQPGEQHITISMHAESGIYFWTLQSNKDVVTLRFAVTR
jgi:glucose/arabinose dehydrogenase